MTDSDIPVSGGKEETVEGVKFTIGDYFESIGVSYPATAQISKAEYRTTGSTGWTEIDSPLVRNTRTDVLGLTAGEYSLKLSTNAGKEYVLDKIAVKAYDRSGYAHFKRNPDEAAYNGIGAYGDNGVLKEGALVIYVTNENKNNVRDSVYKNVAGKLVKEDISAYIKPGRPQLSGKDLGGDSYFGIGYILNNRGYENNGERERYGIQKLSQVYGGVAVRILGTVTSEFNSDGNSPTLFGLTYRAKSGETNPLTGGSYGSTGVLVPNGGSVGDGGQMARITNAYNLTIEGVGEGAKMQGWGVHFISNDNLHKNKDSGTSFEVRQLTFDKYVEDAIGMEGTQGLKVDPATGSITSGDASADADLVSPVERCWVHNNTFFPGYAAAPTESDKAEGDGSCDFKRGQYFTLSYNYFEYCHKTNLIGSSDASLSYNITFHHNWWNNCGARQPLLRRANIHFYNNYVSGDSTDKNVSLSYVTSLRANSYMFSEANYYDGTKNTFDKGDGGAAAKLYNNIFVATFGVVSTSAVTVKDREEKVSNSCKFNFKNIDYSSFDTNSTLFYYDATAKRSDCLLDSAAIARVKAMTYAGANGHGNGLNVSASKFAPTTAVQLAENGTTTIALPTAKGDSAVNGVLFRNITGASGGTVKGKGQIIIFTLSAEAELTCTTDTSGDPAPDLYDKLGNLYAGNFTGTLKTTLSAGTYVIASGQKDKEAVISSLSFTSTANTSKARVEAAKAAINAIPANVTLAAGAKIEEATVAYNALTDSDKATFPAELKTKLEQAQKAYDDALVADAIQKIDAIGEITDVAAGDRILAARNAVNLVPQDRGRDITNYSKLTKAELDYKNVAAQYVSQDIDALANVSGYSSSTPKATVTSALAEYDRVSAKYDALEEAQKAQVAKDKADKLANGRANLTVVLREIVSREGFEAAIEEITDVAAITIAQADEIVTYYNDMSTADKETFKNNEVYVAALAKKEAVASKTMYLSWTEGGLGNGNSTDFDVSGKTATSKGSVTVDGFTYTTCLKMESSTSVTFTITGNATITLYFAEGGKKVKINGKVATTNSDGVVTVLLSAETDGSTVTITKSETMNLFLIVVQ